MWQHANPAGDISKQPDIIEKSTVAQPQEPVKPEQSQPNGKNDDIVDKKNVNRAEKLIEHVKSTDWRIRVKAQEELVKIGSSAVPKLLEALSGKNIPPHAKPVIINALGQIGDPRAVNSLVETLSDGNSYVRRCAAQALGRIKDPGAVNPLIGALSDEDASVRQRAAISLGNLNDKKAVPDLIERLDDKDERVCVSVTGALAKMKDGRAVQPLISQLMQKRSQLCKNEIIWALGELGERNALPALEDYLKKLLAEKPRDKMKLFAWESAVKTAKEAISKLQ